VSAAREVNAGCQAGRQRLSTKRLSASAVVATAALAGWAAAPALATSTVYYSNSYPGYKIFHDAEEHIHVYWNHVWASASHVALAFYGSGVSDLYGSVGAGSYTWAYQNGIGGIHGHATADALRYPGSLYDFMHASNGWST
jgi:hypothetical protein